MSRPTKEEIESFLKCFDELASFEGTQRMIRSYGGLYNEEQINELQPVNLKVRAWLMEEFNIEDKVINICLPTS
jgi:hypothetical protein